MQKTFKMFSDADLSAFNANRIYTVIYFSHPSNS